jgi:protease II
VHDFPYRPDLFTLLHAPHRFIYVFAHVRGGGECGRAWHAAAQAATKALSALDTIDCAQWLIAQKWTTARQLAVWGNSAGG